MAESIEPTSEVSRRTNGDRAYACMRQVDWAEMEWQLPVVLTAEMQLDFFLVPALAVDFAVAQYAQDMASHIGKIAKKKPMNYKRRLSSPPRRPDISDDVSEAPFSVQRGSAAEPADVNEPADVSETLPEALERMCRHQWYLIRIPYDKSMFVSNDHHVHQSLHLRKYVTLDEMASFTPVSVPGPSTYIWAPICTVAEQALRERQEEKKAAKRRLVAEKEDCHRPAHPAHPTFEVQLI